MTRPATAIHVWLSAAVNFICIMGIIFQAGRICERLDNFIVESRSDRTEIKQDLKDHLENTRNSPMVSRFIKDPNRITTN
jgi:hypothetical protein